MREDDYNAKNDLNGPDFSLPGEESLSPKSAQPKSSSKGQTGSSNEQEDSSHETADSLYLKQLVYTKKAGKTFLNFFIQNFKVIVLLIIAIIVWGVFSFTMLPLESNPEVKIPYGVVTVALPGASPADVEDLVVRKIEAKVVNINGVKQIRSSALNSFAMVNVEFRAEEDLKDALRRLRDAVSNLKTDLPTDASDPVVTEVSFSNSPVWTLVVTGPYDNFTLRRYAEKVQDELKKLPGASDVTVSGGDVYEMKIIYDPQKLQSYNLSADQVNGVIKANNLSLPLGTINISNFEYSLRTEGKFLNASTLRQLPISSGTNNQIIRLEDVAVVAEMARKKDVYNTFSIKGENPENAVTLNVIKKTGSSIIDLIDGGKEKITEAKKSWLPSNVNVETTLDLSQIIRRDFDQLEHDGVLTILLVTLVLFLFVGLKEAFVAGLAVPLVFCTTFGLMLLTGITLNFLSVFSLILSLGLLVDDAIVVVQATKQYLKTGKFTPEEAVLLVFKDYKILLATTTLTTIWAFVPLLMASGIIGQFIRSIPITVGVTLAASFVIAIIVNHPMAIILERFRVTRGLFKGVLALDILLLVALIFALANGSLGLIGGVILILVFGAILFALIFWYRSSLKTKLLENEDLILQELADPAKIRRKIHHHYLAEESEKSWFDRAIGGVVKMENLLPHYGRILGSILENRARTFLVLGIVALAFIGSLILPITGILRSEFIPPSDSEYLYINIQGAPGLVTEKTREVTAQVEQVLFTEKSILSFSEVVGSGGVNVSTGTGGTSAGGGQGNKAQFAINFYPYKIRPASEATGRVEKSYDVAKRLREKIKPIKGAKIEIVEVAGGPPSGADIEGQIMGDDLKVLEQQANRFKDLLASIPGAINAKTSLTLSPGEFTLKLDPLQMQLHGTSAAQVALTLRNAISGTEITKILRSGDEISVRAEFDENKIKTIDQLKSLNLLNARGQIFQLGDVAEIQLGSALTAISRVDQKRVVTVSAGVEKPHLPAEVLVKYQDLIAKNPLPSGYEIKFGGQNETNAESVYSILRAMLVAMMLIIGTLVIQFNSFRKAVLVLATIPLAMTGVFYGLTVFGFTLSFPGLIGILALFGVVVKNAVILVDKINLNLRVGIGFVDSIVDASKSRLEAIFLTSICTIIGMIPITLANETWQGLGASLIFGLSTSTFLTLFIIPILFSLFMKKDYEKQRRLAELKAELKAKLKAAMAS